MKIAITGSKGFIGLHLVNTLIFKNKIDNRNIVYIKKEDFNNRVKLKNKLKDCSTIVHLAGVNRHSNTDFLFKENIRLTNCLIKNISKKTDLIIFASSVQQDLKNPFGESKYKCSQLFAKWALSSDSIFVNLKIPNVFGPFGKPNYNSFVSTFCNNLVLNKKSEVRGDNSLNLLYIDYLIDSIISLINKSFEPFSDNNVVEISNFDGIQHKSVSEVFRILETQWKSYENNIIPNITSDFERNLFNTLRSFIYHDCYFPKILNKHNDERGFFSEIIKTNSGGQFSISTTLPGITRGNHFHTRKIERFIVTQGNALIELRRIDSNEKLSFKLDSENLNYIDMPIWYTHKIKNIGNNVLTTLFWINEPYDPENSDTYQLEV